MEVKVGGENNHYHDQPKKLSRMSEDCIESMKVALASEVMNYFGIIMQAVTCKMTEAIAKAELPSQLDMKQFEERLSRSFNPETPTPSQ